MWIGNTGPGCNTMHKCNTRRWSLLQVLYQDNSVADVENISGIKTDKLLLINVCLFFNVSETTGMCLQIKIITRSITIKESVCIVHRDEIFLF